MCNHGHHLPVPDVFQVLGLGARLLVLPTPVFSQMNFILRDMYKGNIEGFFFFFPFQNEPAGLRMGRLTSQAGARF